MLSPILDVLKAVDEGKIQTYYDVIQLSSAPVPAPEQR
jgi:alkylated DNA nucleotide flippase Atl1